MNNDRLPYDVHKARIYKNIYRRSTNPFHLFGALVSVLLQGRSQVGSSASYANRRPRY